MPPTMTDKQAQFLAFIRDYTARRGIAPSFEEIGAHFGTAPPNVNDMIKRLERRGFLSRMPGAARTLRVLVQPPVKSDFGGRRARTGPDKAGRASPVDVAVAVGTAILDVVMTRCHQGAHDAGPSAASAVVEAAREAGAAAARAGLDGDGAIELTRRLSAEAARWQADGRGVVVPRRSWRPR